ncbi:preprotein translocase subunit YajC [candidate division WOR-3 bacterium]|uniref:Preprotein translocase subunit YajC n=1 Tax=candidate division WOR-3 bacterium TaxID=2052148 RepID=A0A9D5QEU7_UNCW3|nr:preprotein translocase subunit YajC [candidate division WOR-3 bacterium]MBD3365370.1 preprotein translocase subunit YajC [candidate division WOR-3 bacterium]
MIFKLGLVFLLVGQATPTGEAEPVESEPTTVVEDEGTEVAEPGTELEETEAVTDTAGQPADSTAVEGKKPKRPWLTWVILLGVLVVFYLLMILPQRRRQKKHQQMLKSLNRGDRIMTNGGVVGTISKVKEETFVIKTAGKTEIEIDKSVVQQKK